MDTRQDEPGGKEATRPVGEQEVYPPSEDTFFLASWIEDMPRFSTSLEVGVGSGYVTAILAGRSDYTVGTDVSLKAATTAKDNLSRRMVDNFDIVVTDKAFAFREKAFQLVVSNPPYLPCEYSEEPLWCGGPSGVEFSLELAEEAQRLLKAGGVLVLVASSLSNFEKLVGELKKLYKAVYIVQEREVSLFEKLFILECRA
ncbi:methyltransferase [Infirmifilum lucidum]|uniref:Methyltransferase n=1 Tax=Infirmifilum lucidum TaxID=2776706 RepID=A0A7L9FIM1_9CREN|nr:methyltransferase [Infirmifilum lucidum]QOJ79481.1 methyltransferase [Infirmifilum lucidum]